MNDDLSISSGEEAESVGTADNKDTKQHIRDLNITTVLIAHRLSTIRDSDCIYVMERGHVIQQGTHSQLMQQEGLYSELMKYA